MTFRDGRCAQRSTTTTNCLCAPTCLLRRMVLPASQLPPSSVQSMKWRLKLIATPARTRCCYNIHTSLSYLISYRRRSYARLRVTLPSLVVPSLSPLLPQGTPKMDAEFRLLSSRTKTRRHQPKYPALPTRSRQRSADMNAKGYVRIAVTRAFFPMRVPVRAAMAMVTPTAAACRSVEV